MSGKLKVEFVDNSASQYDANASLIEYGAKRGKLFLGDRYAASYVQLKARNCKTVVNCCQDMHGFAKEADVNYLKIDPDDEGNDHFDESFQFIDENLAKKKNVVVHCENGFSKSAVIVMHFLMKKKGIPLSDSLQILRDCRGSVKIPPRLVKLLVKAEMKQRGFASIRLDERYNIVPMDGGLNLSKRSAAAKGNSKKDSNTGMYVGIGLVAFFGVLYALLVAFTGKS